MMTYLVKIQAACFLLQVFPGACKAAERGTDANAQALTFLQGKAQESPHVFFILYAVGMKNSRPAVYTMACRQFFHLHIKPAAKAGGIAPALVNTVSRIVAPYFTGSSVYMYHPLAPVAVGRNEQEQAVVLLQGKLH